ncbi:tyrosine-type recombinase/integrase [Bacillus safensis]|uniref:tyrosine-type recombinase/integrase n=1 Tax=Bacillus safensis TaxID=561879 RepID=UPI00227E6D1A|nr:tyrosine-type recombinase/integrase [Bacillus safensis]MCY7585928.1 tyrosine-type recombinase/integrase [Bacillus safensis]
MKRQLRKYVQIRGDVPNEALFVTIDNTPLTIRQVQNRLRKYGRKANIKNVRCSPHTFRHTFAKMSVQNGADVFALQAVLWHTSLDMVRNYVNLFSSDVMDAHKKFSPVEKLF